MSMPGAPRSSSEHPSSQPMTIGTSGAAPCAQRGAVTEKLRTQLGCRGPNGGANGGPAAEMENLVLLKPKWGQHGPCIQELHARPRAARGTAHTQRQPGPSLSRAGRGGPQPSSR